MAIVVPRKAPRHARGSIEYCVAIGNNFHKKFDRPHATQRTQEGQKKDTRAFCSPYPKPDFCCSSAILPFFLGGLDCVAAFIRGNRGNLLCLDCLVWPRLRNCLQQTFHHTATPQSGDTTKRRYHKAAIPLSGDTHATTAQRCHDSLAVLAMPA